MKYFVIFTFGLIIGFLLSFFSYGNYTKIEMKDVFIRDTIIKTLASEPVILEKVKMKIVYLKDTIIHSYPFEARIDTVIIRDTLNATYRFPDNIFSLALKRPQDTIKTIYNLALPQTKSNWQENLIYFGAGVLSGGLIISLVK